MQKGKDCGKIRKTTLTDASEIDETLRAVMEGQLMSDPQHQGSYYDLLLVDRNGVELDFETGIAGRKAVGI